MAINTQEIQKECIRLVEEEVRNWKDAEIYITPKVSFQARDAIETYRKNYYGVFDKPIDPTTGRKKIWIPLTEAMVEAIVAKTDLDQKDVNFYARNPKGRPVTQIVRAVSKQYLDEIYFGEHLDESERLLAIDGTVVWKTVEVDGRPEKQIVDLLNCYIDPTERNIQDAIRFTERSLMTPEEIKAKDWENTNAVQGETNLHKTNPGELTSGRTTTTAKLVDVYELWGRIPKWVVTGNEADRESGAEIEGRIVVSGLDTDNKQFHFVEENTKKDARTGKILKPYEEARYQKVPGRWYGRGVAEKLLMLQLWINIVINIRINRSYIAQLGLFKVRKGSGITAAKLKNLPANGAITVNSLDDIESFVMQEASQASYNDEQTIIDWAERVTAAFSVVTGEQLPSSTPATNAVIQDRNARSQFVLVQDQVGKLIERWMDRHVLPILTKNLKPKAIVRLARDESDIKELADRIVAYMAEEELDKYEASLLEQQFTSFEDVEQEMRKVERFKNEVLNLQRKIVSRPELFVEVLEKIVSENLDTKVQVTNEEMDIGVTIQNAIQMAQIAPQFADQLLKDAADLMGFQLKESNVPQLQQAVASPVADLPVQSEQSLVTDANVPSINPNG